MKAFFFSSVCFSLHVKYTPYVQRVVGSDVLRAETKTKTATSFHRRVSLRRSSENRIGVRSFLSYTNVLHVSSLLRIITAVLFSIVNVPYKKKVVDMHILSLTVSASSRRRSRFRAADGASSDAAQSCFIITSTLTTSPGSSHMIQMEL